MTFKHVGLWACLVVGTLPVAWAQQVVQPGGAASASVDPCTVAASAKPAEREARLLECVAHLANRVAALEARLNEKAAAAPATDIPAASAPAPARPSRGQDPPPSNTASSEPALPDWMRGTTFNVNLDTYYSHNFNRPLGRINLLRAYDVTSQSFSLNQAGIVVERAPDVAAGRRWGLRLDLMYGRATEALQGSAANEPRPQAYRPVFQAYGTYVFPVAKGLTADFGKFASAMGYENNYSKDQFNYSRSYFFSFLPSYHMGFRNTIALNDKLSLGYWMINGVQQTEDFNAFKSQVVQVTVKPKGTLQWNVIYHVGREQRDLVPDLNPGIPTLPTQPGLSTTPIVPAPDGRLHILDTYLSWSATAKLTLAAEADYVINRQFEHSAPAHVAGGAAYAHYQVTPKAALSLRGEYLSDRGGLFSGVTQALKETTVTYEYRLADGFLSRAEWRRDFSNQPFFFTPTPGILKKEQNTLTLGLIWWFGGKQGAW